MAEDAIGLVLRIIQQGVEIHDQDLFRREMRVPQIQLAGIAADVDQAVILVTARQILGLVAQQAHMPAVLELRHGARHRITHHIDQPRCRCVLGHPRRNPAEIACLAVIRARLAPDRPLRVELAAIPVPTARQVLFGNEEIRLFVAGHADIRVA